MLAISHQPSTAIELNLFNRLQLPLPQQPLPKLSTATATTLAGQRRKTDNDNLGWNGNWKHLAPCTYYYSTTALQCRRTHSVGWQHHQSEATEEKKMKWNEKKRGKTGQHFNLNVWVTVSWPPPEEVKPTPSTTTVFQCKCVCLSSRKQQQQQQQLRWLHILSDDADCCHRVIRDTADYDDDEQNWRTEETLQALKRRHSCHCQAPSPSIDTQSFARLNKRN